MDKIKFWLETTKGKITFTSLISVTITVVIMLVIFLPFLLSGKTTPTNPVIAYNRDSISGTREAFENSINFDENNQRYTSNVLTVSGNDDMIRKVSNSTNSFGYASLFSLITKDKEGNYVLKDNSYRILNLNDVNPIEDIKNNMDNYASKREFNIFFRVDSKYNTFIQDNLYNSSTDNLWDEGITTPVGDWKGFSEAYKINNSLDLNVFLYSFLFYNWLLFSSSAYEVLPLSLSLNDVNFNKGMQNFITNVGVFSDAYEASNENIDIYLVGSTSVASSLTNAEKNFLEDLSNIFASLKITETDNIIFNQNLKGSGDAFKSDTNIGSSMPTKPWIAFQSRSPEEINLDKGNYFHQTNETIIGGEDKYDITENSVYASFQIDAIAFIINSKEKIKHKIDSRGTEVFLRPTEIQTNGINLIYTKGLNFEELYNFNLLKAEEI